MKKTPTLLASALLSLSAFSSAYAAETVDLTVSGTIQPAACEPTLASNVIDYGTISQADLNTDTPTALPARTVGMTVNCSAVTLWGLRGVDLRAASAGANANGLHFGLGKTDADENIGYYSISLTTPQADGNNVRAVRSNDGFTTVTADGGLSSTTGWISALAPLGADQPLPSQSAMTQLQIATFINPTDDLTLSADVDLDGQATLELVYL